MAFFLTPRFESAYAAQQCNPWACAPRPHHSSRRAVRPSVSPFAPFSSGIEELISALDYEARREAALREAHRQRQLRKRIVQAHFNVHENQEGYQIDAELPYFKQEHIEIEVRDDNTLNLSGNTARKAEQQPQSTETQSTQPATEPQSDAVEVVTSSEPEKQPTGSSTPSESDTESHRSYQATVEDDFEDLGAESASIVSAHSETATPNEDKGKGKAVEKSTTTNAETFVHKPQSEVPASPQLPKESEEEQFEFEGSFERNFRFPERIDAANVRASLRNGLLSITIPKAKAPEVRRIWIQ